ncbi:MAG: hypothetical protein QNJ32_17680 [Xenococcaceae cyanobacterium MO_167.B27]|nr:hypothetical protein [Xenococcaceae cyanobacterium MO_167.B27]
MTPNPQILRSVEQLNYRVTVGDVAAQAGLELNLAQQGLLALASDAGGHLQVAESGDIVYSFPKNFRNILRNKYWQLRWQQWWEKVWRVLFYLIRISFGIMLIVSIILIAVAIIAIVFVSYSSSDRDRDDNRGGSYGGGGGGLMFLPRFWITPDIFWLFQPNYHRRPQPRNSSSDQEMNFLEAVFSFLFGDGEPNPDLEANRNATIGQVIRTHQGAVTAEQIAPYVDETDADEDYMIPVLARFNGYPQVSPEGEIIYYFPELQVMADQRSKRSLPSYLQEKLWRFSQATSGQKMLAVGLGALNLVLALVLGSLLRDSAIAVSGGYIGFISSIYWLLLGYGAAFLLVPLIRYFWIQGRNGKITTRNQFRQERAIALENPDPSLQQKILYTRQFAQEKIIEQGDTAYTTETDLLDQNLANKDKLDQEWQQRLESTKE